MGADGNYSKLLYKNPNLLSPKQSANERDGKIQRVTVIVPIRCKGNLISPLILSADGYTMAVVTKSCPAPWM
jgi:hypothetical protein